MKNKRLLLIVSTVAVLLLIPFIAMQFTSEVDWKTGDFAMAGFLLLGTGLLCELALRMIKTRSHRIMVCAVLLIGLALVWMELAVGIVGTPLSGQ